MVIGHIITYMEIKFVQNVDLRKRSYKEFLVKYESEVARKKYIFDLFLQLKIFLVFFFKFLNIVYLDQIQKSHILQEKIAKFKLGHQKKVLDECSSTLEFFLVKYIHVSILVS